MFRSRDPLFRRQALAIECSLHFVFLFLLRFLRFSFVVGETKRTFLPGVFDFEDVILLLLLIIMPSRRRRRGRGGQKGRNQSRGERGDGCARHRSRVVGLLSNITDGGGFPQNNINRII